MRVEVYRNLHTDTWSMRQAHGTVLAHPRTVILNEPTFVVRPAGRDKVRAEGRKCVHALVRGEVMVLTDPVDPKGWRRATYNPYRNDTFVDVETGEAVHRAAVAWLHVVDDKFVVDYLP
jgi:hypothetical protein